MAAAFSPDAEVWLSWAASADEIAAWSDVGCDAATGAAWTAYGCIPADSVAFREAGMRMNGAVPWWVNPTDPPFLEGPALTVAEIPRWAAAMSDPEYMGGFEASKFAGAGWEPDDAAPWIEAGFVSPAEVDWWKATASSPEPDINHLGDRWESEAPGVDAFSNQLDGALRIRRMGIHDPREFVAQVLSFTEAASNDAVAWWHLNGVPRSYCERACIAWSDIYSTAITDPRVVHTWHQRGLDPAKAKLTHLDRWTAVPRADVWIGNGFTADDAAAWVATGVHSSDAVFWREIGLGPRTVRDWQEAMSTISERPHTRPLFKLVRSRGGSPEQAQLLGEVAYDRLS